MVNLRRGDTQRIFEKVVEICRRHNETPPSRTTVYDFVSGRTRTNHEYARRINEAIQELKPAQAARRARKSRGQGD